jgi:leucyl aminopeptidase
VLDAAAMRTLGMNALLGVASGSDEPSAFIVVRYGAAREGAAPLGLIGKGITFDSGGISIKPAENMHEMKGDMGGAAAVLGAMRAIAGLGLDLAVTAVVPATENLPGGRAQVPGDVVRAMNGVTIEIINTDAEGRLILADALSYAVREGLSPLVDVATLTGACSVALGPFYTGVFGNDDGTAAALLDAARRAGEKMWRMPLDVAYEELIKSDVADIKNSAGRTGGAITAAMFLQHFVGDTPWVHLDIAPTSWSNKDEGEQSTGGSGVAVRTLVALAERLAAQ